MRATRAAGLLLVAVVACRPDTVALAYRYPAGDETTYRLTAEARARWDIGGPGSGSYRVVFQITEHVDAVDDDGATVTVEMRPIDVSESGLPSPGSAVRSFTLRVAPHGEVLEVLAVDGISARDLDPDQLIFIGTYRPTLPLEAVRLDDEWSARQDVGSQASFQQIATTTTLESYDVDGDGRTANIAYSGTGPFTAATRLPQGEAELAGTVDSAGRAVFDLDAGFLRSAESSTTGAFDVRVVAREGALPITGTMQLGLELHVEKL